MSNILKLITTFLLFGNFCFAQNTQKSTDDLYKEKIYNSCKKKIINYSLKDFDGLFFEFMNKNNDPKIVMTREEYYNYTIQIAAFSDRWMALYPEQKTEAEANKKTWQTKTYGEYLTFKSTQKK